MFDNCQLILKNCQHPREFNSFVEEFLIDIRATVAAMEDVCPIAKHKSLKDCSVLSDNKDHVSLITFPILVNEIVAKIEWPKVAMETPEIAESVVSYPVREELLEGVNPQRLRPPCGGVSPPQSFSSP